MAVLTLLRRWLVVVALMFWQGGFTFYVAVVVPVAQDEIGHTAQGFITRHVTNWLNLAGSVALLVLAWDLVATPDPSAWRRRGRWLSWLGMALTLGVLIWLHPRLDALLDPNAHDVRDRALFRPRHRTYLWVSTIQWACTVLYTILSLWVWRVVDGLLAPINGDSGVGGKRV
jgi:hypothetical protein